MKDLRNFLNGSFCDNLNTNSSALNVPYNLHIDPSPSFSGQSNSSNNIHMIQKYEETPNKIFDLGSKNMNIEEDSVEKQNEEEMENIYERFGKENNENDINKNSKSYLKKKRKASTDKEEKKYKNEDFILKFLTNFINEYEYNKLYKELAKIKIYIQKKCDRKKYIKGNENYLPILLKKKLKEVFDLENILKGDFLSNKEEEKINELLESTIEEELEPYYSSDELKQFRKKKLKDGKTPEDYDKIFFEGRKGKKRGYYLLEPFGFIRYAKGEHYCKNERKKLKKNED